MLAFPAGCVSSTGSRPGDAGDDRPAAPSAAARQDPAVFEGAASARSEWTGADAPPFSLSNADNKLISLKDLRGQWTVLYFYPKNDTPGCTCQATEFTGLILRFESVAAKVYGISPDTAASHREFRDKYQLKVELLADPSMDAIRQFGAAAESQILGKTQTRVVRSTFLINPEGRIAWHWPEVIPNGHAERVLKKLVELRGR